jgi:hypothetical protein
MTVELRAEMTESHWVVWMADMTAEKKVEKLVV